MISFTGNRLENIKLPLSIVWLLETLAESKGRQQLYERQSPQMLKNLKEMALIESAESSNRIEGVTVERNRLRPLVIGNTRPRDRSEEEIVGYRMALNWIHKDYSKIPVTPETGLRLHALAQGGTSGDAGQWKTTQNDIIELFPDGRREVRFQPLAPDLVPKSMEELCLAYREFEERAERQRPKRGTKTDLVEYALQSMINPFGIADVEQLCPSVSRDTIRLVMNRWRERGRLEMLGKGRDAKWRQKKGK